MNKTHYTPIHPGEVLKDELDEIGLSQTALAKHIKGLLETIMKYVAALLGAFLRA